ncbi:hypothetical protein Pan3_35 [Pseudanabaena phage Pan3]|nr:hypothetical protein Pan3_35 [Pseudanabaena phage Pan3]
MTKPVRFTQADLKRAAAGVTAAGLHIAQISVEPSGKIVIIPGKPKSSRGSDEWADLE